VNILYLCVKSHLTFNIIANNIENDVANINSASRNQQEYNTLLQKNFDAHLSIRERDFIYTHTPRQELHRLHGVNEKMMRKVSANNLLFSTIISLYCLYLLQIP